MNSQELLEILKLELHAESPSSDTLFEDMSRRPFIYEGINTQLFTKFEVTQVLGSSTKVTLVEREKCSVFEKLLVINNRNPHGSRVGLP